ncbi:MAG: hypothetical protein ACFFBD_13435 [Candidatus Hodarchaeota archaeon]
MSEEMPTGLEFFQLSDDLMLVYNSLLVVGPQSKAELKLSTKIENIDEIVASLIDASLARRLESKDFDIIWPIPPFRKIATLENETIKKFSEDQKKGQSEFELLEKKSKTAWQEIYDLFSQRIDILLKDLDQEKDNSQSFAEDQKNQLLKIENEKEQLLDRLKERIEEENRRRDIAREEMKTAVQEINQEPLTRIEELKNQLELLQNDVTEKFQIVQQNLGATTSETSQQLKTQINERFKSVVKNLNKEFRGSALNLEKNAKDFTDSASSTFATSKETNLNTLEKLRLELSQQITQDLFKELETNITSLKGDSIDKISQHLADNITIIDAQRNQIQEAYQEHLDSLFENLTALTKTTSKNLEDSKKEISQVNVDTTDQLQEFFQNLQENVSTHFQASTHSFESEIQNLDESINKLIQNFQKLTKGTSETAIDDFVTESKKLSDSLTSVSQEVQENWIRLDTLKQTLMNDFKDFSGLLKDNINNQYDETQNIIQLSIKESVENIQYLSTDTQGLFLEVQNEGKEKAIENTNQIREEMDKHLEQINSITDTFREGLVRTFDDVVKKWEREIPQFNETVDSHQTKLIGQINEFSSSIIAEFQESTSSNKLENSRLLLEIENQVTHLLTETRKEVQKNLTDQKADVEDAVSQYAQNLEGVLDNTLEEVKTTFDNLKATIRENAALKATGISSVFEKHQRQFNDLFTRFSTQSNTILKNLKENTDSSYEVQQELVETKTKTHSESLQTSLSEMLHSYRELQDKYFQDTQSNLNELNKETAEKTDLLKASSNSLVEFVVDGIKRTEEITTDTFGKLKELEKNLKTNLDNGHKKLSSIQSSIQEGLDNTREGLIEVTDSLVSKASESLETGITTTLETINSEQSEIQNKSHIISNNFSENIKQIYENAYSNTETELKTLWQTSKEELDGKMASFKDNTVKIQESVTGSYVRLTNQIRDTQTQTKENIEQFVDSFQDNTQTLMEKIQKDITGVSKEYMENQTKNADEITTTSSEMLEQMIGTLSEQLESSLTHQKAITTRFNELVDNNFDVVTNDLTERYDQLTTKLAAISKSFKTRSKSAQESTKKILENASSTSISPIVNTIDEIPKSLEELVDPLSEFLELSKKTFGEEYISIENEIKTKIVAEALRKVENQYKNNLKALQEIQSRSESELLELFDSVTDLSRSISSDIVSNYSTQILTAIEKVKSDAQENIIKLREELNSSQEENTKFLSDTQQKVQKAINDHITSSKSIAESFNKLEEAVSQLELLKFAETRLVRGDDIPKVIQAVIERSSERLTIVLPALEPNPALTEFLAKVPTFIRIRLIVWFPPAKKEIILPWLKEIQNKIVNIKISKVNTEIKSIVVDRDGKEMFLAMESAETGFLTSNEKFVRIYEEYIAPILTRAQIVTR